MQLLILALVVAIFLHNSGELGAGGPWEPLGPWALLHGAAVLGYAAVCRGVMWMISRRRPRTAMRLLDGAGWGYRLAIGALFLAGLTGVGTLVRLRETFGNYVLIDELAVLTPPLAMILVGWALGYPIDRRIREAGLIRRIDQGLPIYPVPTLRQHVIAQLRHQVAVILVPLLMLMAWTETLYFVIPPAQGYLVGALGLAGAGGVFVCAPAIIRRMWDTQPLPDGPLRNRLVEMCQMHHVPVRELLLWRTFGSMANAAVMGLLGRLRYILLTDALLDMMRQDQIEAVMAHEIAHVRRKHFVWLILTALAIMAAAELLFSQLLNLSPPDPQAAAAASFPATLLLDAENVKLVASVGAIGCWALGFGWVSRRLERQADTFAVQHLARVRAAAEPGDGPVVIDETAAGTMIAALQQVAELNHLSPTRRSWRHGSIAWRQNYLHSLVGQPIDDLAIDRTVRRIQHVTLATLALLAIVAAVL